jgi:ribonuclease HI
MVHLRRAILFFDGASKNNPRGPAGCGFVVQDRDNGRVVLKGYKYLGRFSNNQAEYSGLLEGLKAIDQHLTVDELHIRGDSEVVIKQVRGSYQVRSNNLRPVYSQVMELLGSVPEGDWSATHVGRNQNNASDLLANRAIHTRGSNVELYV